MSAKTECIGVLFNQPKEIFSSDIWIWLERIKWSLPFGKIFVFLPFLVFSGAAWAASGCLNGWSFVNGGRENEKVNRESKNFSENNRGPQDFRLSVSPSESHEWLDERQFIYLFLGKKLRLRKVKSWRSPDGGAISNFPAFHKNSSFSNSCSVSPQRIEPSY